MLSSINRTDFVETFVENFDRFEPYGYRLADESTEIAKTSIQLYAAGINSNELNYHED